MDRRYSTISLFLAGLISFGVAQAQNSYVRIPKAITAGVPIAQTYDFGDVGVGQYVQNTFSYRNESGEDFTILGTTATGADIVGSDCGAVLPAQSFCSITIGMYVGQLGAVQGHVDIQTSQKNGVDILTVTAKGVDPSHILNVTPGEAGYSTNGQEKIFTVTNPRDYAVNVGAVQVSSSYWKISSNTCIGDLQAGASCTVGVKYNTTRTGSYSAFLKILSQSIVVGTSNLAGGVVLGAAEFSTSSINASSLLVGSPYTGTLSVTNVGKGPLTINSVGLDSAAGQFTITSDQCSGVTMNTNQSCSVGYSILFTSVGSLQRSLVFSLSNAVSSVASVGIYAAAVEANPVLSVLPSTVDFGTVVVGQASNSQDITLQSTGTSPVTVSDVTVSGTSASLFTISNKAACIGALSEGNQCVLHLTYGPAATAANHTATVNFSSNSTIAPQAVLLKGTSALPSLTVTPSSVSLTGVLGAEYSQDVVVSNGSSVPTTLKTITSSSGLVTTAGSCAANLDLAAGDSCVLRVTLANSAPVGTGSATITLTHTGSNVAVPVAYTITPPKVDPVVSEITCPVTSVSMQTGGALATTATADSCTFTVTNPSAVVSLYVPAAGVEKQSGSTLFNLRADEVSSAVTLAPGASKTFTIRHQVPATSGSNSAVYAITATTQIGNSALSSVVQKTATATTEPALFAVTDVVCPASVTLGSTVACTAKLSNNSISSYTTFLPLTTKSSLAMAPKFSEVTLNGGLLSSVVADRPATDYSSSNPSFVWFGGAPTSCSSTASSATKGVAAGNSCSFSLSFTPALIGAYSIPFYALSDNSIAIKSNTNAAFTVVEPANGALSNLSCPALSYGQTGSCTATLTNSATQAAISVSGISNTTNSIFGAVTHNCGSSLAAKATCTLTIPVTGNSIGTYSTTLNATANGVALNTTGSVTVGLATANATLSAFTCPGVYTSATSTCTASLKNNGTSALNISTMSVTNPAGFGTPTSSSMSVAAGATATITVTFSSATAGTFTSPVVVNFTTYQPISSNASIVVSSIPAATGSLSAVSCGSFAFSQNGLCVATLTNNSSLAALPITSITKSSASSVFGTLSHTCGTSLAASANCSISVPVSGSATGTFSFTLTATTNPVLTQTGTVVISPLLMSLTPAADVATDTNRAVNQTTTIKNNNSFAVVIPAASFTLTGTGFSVVSNACSATTLAANATCDIVTSYKGATGGTFSGNIAVSYGGVSLNGPLNVTVATPKLTVAALSTPVTTVSGFRSLSGNWYKVTNSSYASNTIATASMANTSSIVLADSAIAGSCYVGKVLAASESCLVLEQFNVTSMGGTTSVYNTNTGTITTSSGLSAAWASSFATQIGTASSTLGSTATTMPGSELQGTITYVNPSFSSVQGVSFRKGAASTTTGTLTFTSGTCSGIIPPSGTCQQNYTYVSSAIGAQNLVIEATGQFARIINNTSAGQGWGETALVATVPTTVITTLAPTGVVTAGTYSGTNTTAVSTFKNTSAFPVTVTNVTLTGATDQSLSSSDCSGATLAANATCSITTTRTISDGSGVAVTRTPATITVQVANAYNFTAKIISSPIGTSAVNFGTVTVNSASTAQSVTLYNTTASSVTATVTIPTGVARVYQVAGDCTASGTITIGANASCVLKLTWTPTDEGVWNNTMNVVISGFGSYDVPLTGTGNIPVGTLTNLSSCLYFQFGISMDSVNHDILMASSSNTGLPDMSGYGGRQKGASEYNLSDCGDRATAWTNRAQYPFPLVTIPSGYTSYDLTITNTAAYHAPTNTYVYSVNIGKAGSNTPPKLQILGTQGRGSSAALQVYGTSVGSIYNSSTKKVSGENAVLRVITNRTNSVVYILRHDYVAPNNVYRVYSYNPSSASGLSLASNAQLYVGARDFAVDGRDDNIIWFRNVSSFYNLNVSTGVVSGPFIPSGSLPRSGALVDTQAVVDSQGIYYLPTDLNGGDVGIDAVDLNTMVSTRLYNLPANQPVRGLVLSSDQRFLYLGLYGGGLAKLKIRQ